MVSSAGLLVLRDVGRDPIDDVLLLAARDGQLLVTVTAGSGTPPVFTDNPLVVGGTVVRAVHLTELRDAVNQARARAGLAAATWTDSSLTGIAIKAVHITEMRTTLDEARAVLGLPAASYQAADLSG